MEFGPAKWSKALPRLGRLAHSVCWAVGRCGDGQNPDYCLRAQTLQGELRVLSGLLRVTASSAQENPGRSNGIVAT